ncbi:MAG: sigma 54-interacting transcriptional regulator [Treponema sp.]|nr:sigma 54-interacting transcriptional regulator [Treponema sp.]
MAVSDAAKLTALIEINAKINSSYSSENALLTYILESAMRLLECEASSVILEEEKSKELVYYATISPDGSKLTNTTVERNSIAGWTIENNIPVIIDDVESDFRYSPNERISPDYVLHTMIVYPFLVKGKCIGVVELINKSDGRNFDSSDLEILKILCDQASIAYQNAKKVETNYLNTLPLHLAGSSRSDYHTFIAKSPSVLDLIHVIEEVAVTNSSVLITGESGVGKELFAEQLHLKSLRSSKPFIRVNCAALSPSLLESELFGHVKGAFTDAVSEQEGRFKAADGGTLFLDEIGEFPLDLQAKLLRVIQARQFEPVGSSKTISVDVRIVAATNRDLEAMVKNGTFRTDLYYRLNVLPINIPSLRERKEDIEPLSEFFLQKFGEVTKKKFSGFSPEAIQALHNYYWPGNIRELENTVERACVLGMPPYIQLSDLRLPGTMKAAEETKEIVKLPLEEVLAEEYSESSDGDRTLKTAINKFKKAYVCKILDQTSWNQTKAGKILGIQRTYVSRLLNELHIREEKDLT